MLVCDAVTELSKGGSSCAPASEQIRSRLSTVGLLGHSCTHHVSDLVINNTTCSDHMILLFCSDSVAAVPLCVLLPALS